MDSKLKTLIEKVLVEEPDEVLKLVLENPIAWPVCLDVMTKYERGEDDSPNGKLAVIFSPDGDAWIEVISKPDPDEASFSMRFRNYFGGGRSLRVHNALRVLAVAIALDNELPQP